MRSRCTLHVKHLEAFKEYLEHREIPYRPGQGYYEVLQVQTHKGWRAIYAREQTNAGNKLEHYTIYGELVPIVAQFISSHRRRQSE